MTSVVYQAQGAQEPPRLTPEARSPFLQRPTNRHTNELFCFKLNMGLWSLTFPSISPSSIYHCVPHDRIFFFSVCLSDVNEHLIPSTHSQSPPSQHTVSLALIFLFLSAFCPSVLLSIPTTLFYPAALFPPSFPLSLSRAVVILLIALP